MSFYKQSISNLQNNEIVEIVENKICEKCGLELNMMKSKNGLIECHKCGYKNMITENKNEPRE